ncbi:universal stress protein [Paraburkholderia sp. B3]|uniref:universal stress protein n=1 Tax=Paraburkholderia sp. B3 TaxID=3134791 RepID=UPI003982B12E
MSSLPNEDNESGNARFLYRRISLAAIVDAACETLARHGIEADNEILQAEPGAAQTEALACAVRGSEAELAIGSPDSLVLLAGSTDCPVLALPTPFARRCQVPPRRIFVASDGSAESAFAVREAARIATPGVAVRVAYLACDPVAALHPEDFDAVVLEARHDSDDVSHAIAEAARRWHTDLLMLGPRGGHASGRQRYGSIAADVVQRTVLPLLLVPQTSQRAGPAAANGVH